ncbi:MAG: hypothetical protein IT449_05365 [Phycisphaerales bacterium]|nr:hypothetical protein [Phycisphaerales bacterium]
MDLVTGLPLIQATDFELPFGGAVFRHIRTWSADFFPHQSDAQAALEGVTRWDWQGQGWMMSEQPFLLFDAWWEWLGEYGGGGSEGPPKRCYLIPDSHHSIPFLYDTNQNAYIAPQWFDAILDHNGASGQRPTEVYVWLQRQSIKYTFELHAEDAWRTAEGEPYDGEYPEWPVYGLIRSIEDRYGNSIDYEYCGDTDRYPCQTSQPPNDPCCCQDCVRKGQIRRIRLRTAPAAQGPGPVVWTLVYTYRGFGLWPENLKGKNALHSIHVYEGDVDFSDSCLTIDDYAPGNGQTSGPFCCAQSLDEIDALNHEDLPTGWKLEARYTYMLAWENVSTDDCPDPLGYCQSKTLFRESNYISDPPVHNQLAKATVNHRPSSVNFETESSHYLYFYERDNDNGAGWIGVPELMFPTEIYEPSTVAKLMAVSGLSANELLTLERDELLPDPTEPEGREFWEYADLTIGYMIPGCDVCPSDRYSGQYDGADTYFADNYVQHGDHQHMPVKQASVTHLIDRRPDSSSQGWYAYYPYLKLPIECAHSYDVSFMGMMGHYPYSLGPGYQCDPQLPSLAEGFYATIVDELDADQIESKADNLDPYDAYSAYYIPTENKGLRSRRYVEFNKAGFEVFNQEWQFTQDGEQFIQQSGFRQSRLYDFMLDGPDGDELADGVGEGYLLEIRSTGWNAVANLNTKETDGLVRVLTYEPSGPNGRLGELHGVGIKRGASEPFQDPLQDSVYWLSRVDHHTLRPDLVTASKSFLVPTTDFDAAGSTVAVTNYEYTLADQEEGESSFERAVLEKEVVAPASRLHQADADSYYGVERWQFNEKGNTLWHGLGSLKTPGSPGAGDHDAFFITKFEYDQDDRPITQIVDHPGNPEDSNYQRIGPGTPLEYTTTYSYDDRWRLHVTTFPNGRQEHVVYVEEPDEITKKWTYRDVVLDGQAYAALSPVQIEEITGRKLSKTEKVKLDALHNPPDGLETYGAEDILATLVPSYDAGGRLTGMSGESGGESLSAAISYSGFGQVARQQDPAGTLTRNTYDDLGRLEKTYRGSRDKHPFWRNIPPTEDPDDDLVLLERRYYSDGTTDTDPESYFGEGVHDAGLLTKVRSYRQAVTDPYCIDDCSNNNEDALGHVIRHYYDWRMREIMAQRRDESGAALTHSVTWLDHQDRVKFQLEYGPTPPSGNADPRALGADCALPDVATLLGSAPISLTENLYNDRGQVEEVRTYDVSDTQSPFSYTATRTYYNHLSKPTETLSPNAPRQTYTYDALGRQIASSTWAGEIELTRTETQYDADSRPIATRTYERVNGNGDALDDDNSVSTWVYSWFDIAGRLIATANFGTNSGQNESSGANEFVNELPPPDYDPEDPLDPPAASFDGNGRLSGCDGSEFGEETLCTCYEYDDDGRQIGVAHPDGAVTRSEYDGLGRLRLTIENATATNSADKRRTAYKYGEASGLLDAMAAVLAQHGDGDVTVYDEIDWEEDDGSIQVTAFTYGGSVREIVNGQPGSAAVSENPGWIAGVHYPDLDGTREGPTLSFSYYFDGAVASRADARACLFNYSYDELGRLTRVGADDSGWYGEAGNEVGYAPPLRVHQIDYTYNDRSDLLTVHAENHSETTAADVADNEYDYDGRGNLLSEEQNHAAATGLSFIPTVTYEWAYSPAGAETYNFDRLASILYPQRADGGDPRQLSFDYGDNEAGLDSAANRVTAITDALMTYKVAQYNYAGLSRRSGLSVGNGAAQSYKLGSEVGLAGLDRFGRIKDLHYKDTTANAPNPSTIHRYQYGYDRAGNRAYARVAHRNMTSGADPGRDNVRSWLYEYDGLQRLAGARMGQLNAANTAIEPDTDVPLDRALTWDLDDLGNWSGGDSTNGSFVRADDATGDGTPETTVKVHHATNGFNEIDAFTSKTNNNSPVTVDSVYDSAGNLVLDGDYFYQYDAWGRLVQTNRKGLLNAASFDDDGKLLSGEESDLGDLVATYVYDGLGRIVARVLPASYGSACRQYQHYYYDGVRRIQEQWYTETSGCGGGAPTGSWATKREYLHGPDYVDEFVAQVLNPACDGPGGGGSTAGHCATDDSLPVYYLQDANYNVVATLDDGCPSGDCGSGSGGCGEQGAFCPDGPVAIYEQYTYEPYGQPAAIDKFVATPPQNTLGHQGLIFDHYCANTPTDPCILVNHKGLYQNRNRFYHPKLGRFTTPDPNSSAIPLIEGATYHGTPPTALAMVGSGVISDYSPMGAYGDGMNLYGSLGSSPVNLLDALGLFSYGDLLGATAIGADLRAEDAKRVGLAAALLLSMLGPMIATGWGVGGGMSSAGFDSLLEGVDQMMTGAYASAEMAFGAAEALTVFMASAQAAAKAASLSLLPELYAHAAKVAAGGPNDPNFNHWTKEIKAWLNKIIQKTGDMRGKTQIEWRQFAQKFFEWLEHRLGPPPTAPG